MQALLLEVLTALATAAVATLLWWIIQSKKNDHDESDRDR